MKSKYVLVKTNGENLETRVCDSLSYAQYKMKDEHYWVCKGSKDISSTIEDMKAQVVDFANEVVYLWEIVEVRFE